MTDSTVEQGSDPAEPPAEPLSAPPTGPSDGPPQGARTVSATVDPPDGRVPDAGEEDADDVDARPVRPSALRSIVEWVAVIGGALVVALLIRTFLFANFWIPSASMEPTLMGHPGRHDRVVVNKLSYKLHDVRRGDIVVFAKPPGEADSTAGGQQVKDFIKRVIALPGERVTIQAGAVYVDGKRLAEPYLPAGTVTDGRICGFDIIDYRVPKGTVFVMGDNRSNSRDSRCFASRAIKKSSIVGRAFLRIWPLSDFGGI